MKNVSFYNNIKTQEADLNRQTKANGIMISPKQLFLKTCNVQISLQCEMNTPVNVSNSQSVQDRAYPSVSPSGGRCSW